jgi:hypothetical protein
MWKPQKAGQNSPTHMLGKGDDVFWLCYEKIMDFLGNCQQDSSLHHFYVLIFFSCVKAMMANSGSDETLLTAKN